MAELTYSPIQNSVYTGIEYKAHTNGVAPDVSRANPELDFYQQSINLLPRGGRVRTREGSSKILGTGGANAYLGGTEWILPTGSSMTVAAFLSGNAYLVVGSTSWANIMSSAWTIPASGAHVDFVQMRTASSGIRLISVVESPAGSAAPEWPMWWTGATSTTFISLTTAVGGNCAVSWRSHLLLGDTWDTGDGHIPYRIHWSALGDPTVWSGTASAGSLDLLDVNTSKVLRFLPLRRELIAYKEFGAHTITYKGNPFWFTQQVIAEQLNPVGRNAMTAVAGGDAHFLMTTDGFLLWDGQTFQKIGRNRVDRTVLYEFDWTRPELAYCSYFPPTREVIVSYPFLTETTFLRTFVYNLDYNSWWVVDSFAPIGGAPLYKTFATSGPVLMAASRDGNSTAQLGLPKLCYFGLQDHRGPAATSSTLFPVTCTLQFGPFDFGHLSQKRVLQWSPILYTERFSTTPGTVSITCTTRERELAPYIQPVATVDASTTLVVDDHLNLTTAETALAPLQYISNHFAARYLNLHLTWAAASAQVEFHSLYFYAALRGNMRQVKG